ncbi:MAG TPA: acylphosphatase [Anaerolineales bacterium]|nr:acylphosphatase [Anaerolineales bacterium]
MAHSGNIQRVHVWVKGRVQGVGFRAHVQYSARQIGVTGWVRNVDYDTVEAVGEGEREKLDRFVEAVKTGPMNSRVDESNVEWQNATGEFRDFQLRRSM